jgi:response regulator RpfG family c-di-GMP phosphodiesterase
VNQPTASVDVVSSLREFVNMPAMNGYELYRKIRKIDKQAKACFLTASEVYDESLRIPPVQILDDVKCFIAKPITTEDLVTKVKRQLYSQ